MSVAKDNFDVINAGRTLNLIDQNEPLKFQLRHSLREKQKVKDLLVEKELDQIELIKTHFVTKSNVSTKTGIAIKQLRAQKFKTLENEKN